MGGAEVISATTLPCYLFHLFRFPHPVRSWGPLSTGGCTGETPSIPLGMWHFLSTNSILKIKPHVRARNRTHCLLNLFFPELCWTRQISLSPEQIKPQSLHLLEIFALMQWTFQTSVHRGTPLDFLVPFMVHPEKCVSKGRLSAAPNHTLSRNNTLMLQTGTPSLSDPWKALAKISQLINVLFFSPSFWFHFSWIRDITTTLTSKVSQGNIPIFTTEQNESPTKITISLCTR